MKFYRYEIMVTASSASDDYYVGTHVHLTLNEYNLIKETPKGYWISFGISGLRSPKKWIPKESKKRFAYPTKEKALNYFIIRTKRRIDHLLSNVGNCKDALYLADKEQLKLNNHE